MRNGSAGKRALDFSICHRQDDPLGFIAQLSVLRIAEANASKPALKARTNGDHGLRDGFNAGVAAGL